MPTPPADAALPTPARPVLVVGGGAIGLAVGWRLAQAGAAVTLFERGRTGRGTTWLAAGMLAPDAEIGFEELDLYRLSRASLDRWPAFADDLEAASGQSVDYRDEGTLIVADDRDAAERLRRLYDFQRAQGLEVEWLSGAEAQQVEPFVAPRLAAAVFAPQDHQVDNRRVVEALRAAFLAAGGTLREGAPVARVEPDAEAPAVVLADEIEGDAEGNAGGDAEGGARVEGAAVVVAAGVWSRGVEGLTPAPPVRPVKGQMLELTMELPFGLTHVVRGPDAYLAPKSDGRLLVGATSEEMGFDTRVTAGGLYDLLDGAWEVVPGIYDLPVADTWAGLRPASRDHQPLLGPAAPGVVLATGHYRHGVLLTPVTAEAVARLVLTGETSPLIAPFSPARFEARAAGVE
jgi:glycine oxidase